jgi:hypothetical protein
VTVDAGRQRSEQASQRLGPRQRRGPTAEEDGLDPFVEHRLLTVELGEQGVNVLIVPIGVTDDRHEVAVPTTRCAERQVDVQMANGCHRCFAPSLRLSTAKKASCGTSTAPTCFIRFFPFFCRSSSFRLRVMSPP